jgi:hypothetical protein
MSATQTRTALPTNRVNFIYKYDARGMFLALFKHISDAGRTNPDEHFNKSEPEIVKNGTFASPAMALASNVLPVPGLPVINTPLGIRPPSF